MSVKQLLIILLFFVCRTAYSQQPVVFEQINDKNGRPFGRITGVVQDTVGYIWYSTAQGLYRYDGYDYIAFKNRQDDSLSIPKNNITAMYYDREGVLWLRLFDQLVPVKRGKVASGYKKIKQNIYDSDVRLVHDANHNLWITSSKTGLLRYQKKTDSVEYFRKAFNEYKPEAYSYINKIAQKNNGIASVKEVGNFVDTAITFEIKKLQKFVVACAGEQTSWGGDWGCIKKGDEVVWEMDFAKSKYMGGNDSYKFQIDEVLLPAGVYTLCYKSDDSNSQADWGTQGGKPDKINFYGIILFESQSNDWKLSYLETFSRPNTISSDKIADMTLDNNGELCIVTDLGLDFYLKEEGIFKHIEIDYQKLIGNAQPVITFLYCDSKDKFWIGTTSGLIVYHSNSNTFSTIANSDANPNLLTGNVITCMTEDHNGNMWIGTGMGLNFLNTSNGLVEKYTTTSGNRLDDNFIMSVLEDKNNNLWVATKAGLNKMSRQRFFYTPLAIDERVFGYPIYIENKKFVWYQGELNKLFLLNRSNRELKQFELPEKIFDTESGEGYLIRKMFTDSNGLLWFTNGNGLFCFDKIKSEIVCSFKVDDFEIIAEEEKIEIHNKISDVLMLNSNELWVFALNGAYLFNRNSQTVTDFIPYENIGSFMGLSDYVLHVLRDSKNEIWLRTVNGLYLFSPEKRTISSKIEFTDEVRGTSLVYGNIYEDTKGNIWMAVLPKLFKMKNINSKPVEFEFKEAGNVANCRITGDSTANLWIYTENGLIKFNKDSSLFKKFDVGNTALADNHIYHAVPSRNGFLWLLTLKGLTQFDTKTETASNFFTSSDVINIGFVDAKIPPQTNAGEFIFVTTNGLMTYYPDSINQVAPRVVITNFILSKKNYDIEDLIDAQNRLTLDYSENSFTIEFSALDFTDPDRNQYFCKLENYDDEWVEYDVYNRRAVYNKIPPGKYKFKIRASNNDGVWTEKILLTIVLKPPFWKTWWFRILMILLGIGAVWGLIKVRERKLRHDKRVLENIVQERTAKVEQQKLEIADQRDEMMKQRDYIATKNEEIEDSIHYAFRIQKALLPTSENIQKALPEHFILYKPRDIVSGDFYWFSQKKDRIIISAADCTGHGVPGGFMSMLGVSFLNEIVVKEEFIEPDEILNQLRINVMMALKQTGKEGEAKDGMDISLCSIDLEKQKLYFAGAYNPLYMIRNNELTVIKADKMPIGIYMGVERSFSRQEIDIQKGDVIYMSSDGYIDQFGGENGKKFMSKQFKELLLQIHQKDMNLQRELLDKRIKEWIGDSGKYHQIDDIVIVGIRL